jgi:tripartite-type tricarboxylate transporter receptor subunit TctC
MWKRTLSVATAVLVGAGAFSSQVMAQAASYPDRPIHFVLPYGPGGTVDPTTRIIAAGVSEVFGKPTVVENKSGAGGRVGTTHVINSKSDGYTVLVHTNKLPMEPCLMPNLSYNFLTKMKPVMALTMTPFIVVVHPSVPAKNLDELVKHLKANPGKLNYGASGIGSSGQMRGEQFKAQNDVDIAYIPYKDGGSTLKGLVSNEVQVSFDTLPGSIGYIRDGRLKLLGVGTEKPFFLVPDAPTMVGQGYANLAPQWVAAYVPIGVPDAVVKKLAAAMGKALKTKKVQDSYKKLGFETIGTGPIETLKTFAVEQQMWCETIKKAGISIK